MRVSLVLRDRLPHYDFPILDTLTYTTPTEFVLGGWSVQLNLPVLEQLSSSKNILIAGTGGGFDVLIGLPLFFTLRERGKTVHLANFTSCDFNIVQKVSHPAVLAPGLVIGARGRVDLPISYFPEGYLAQWFAEIMHEDATIWMFAKTGAAPLAEGYARLTTHLGIDTLILVDGGVDSLMRGDEEWAGTLVEDGITLTAVASLPIPTKLLVCLGFGSEIEEMVGHHHVLENMAAFAKEEAFLGSCALLPQMEAFQRYEAAMRYIWQQPDHRKGHIHTRIIPAVHGEFGDYHLDSSDRPVPLLISPLLSLYWFFDANAVIRRNLFLDVIKSTKAIEEAFRNYERLRQTFKIRPRRSIPY